MCGVVGVMSHQPVNQLLYDALLLLQHRGQDAAGIVTEQNGTFFMHKANGMVKDVFRTRNMRSLLGVRGLGQVRYPTAGSAASEEEAQPFYVNAPFGVVLVHNGNLTNCQQLREEMFRIDRRHLNTSSDSEVLLNVFAHELQAATQGLSLDAQTIFKAVRRVRERIQGSYAVIVLIAGYGMVAFRDAFGIRPMCFGKYINDNGTVDYMVASESVVLDSLGYQSVLDIKPGETLYFDAQGTVHHDRLDKVVYSPCLFEYVYLARPDSCIDQVSVYEARLRTGHYLAKHIANVMDPNLIDVVMPIPDSSRPAAMQVANELKLDYREGFFKNRYVGRTFIMPGQTVRKKSVRQKLNALAIEFKDKNVLIIDDSIVRGTTSREIIQMARSAGAKKVFFASASPPVRYQNVYGIDMPTANELIAHDRTVEQVAEYIGADLLIYLPLDYLKQAIQDINPRLQQFEASCFDGNYVTGDISAEYLFELENSRQSRHELSTTSSNQLTLQGIVDQ